MCYTRSDESAENMHGNQTKGTIRCSNDRHLTYLKQTRQHSFTDSSPKYLIHEDPTTLLDLKKDGYIRHLLLTPCDVLNNASSMLTPRETVWGHIHHIA